MINSTISQDGTGGKAADEMKLFASLNKQHRVIMDIVKKKPIRFKDAVGRKFMFPFHLACTWAGVENLINQAFLHVDVIGPIVKEGRYDLIGPSGEVILPQIWETVIEPDWPITMHMWPLPEPHGLRGPGPPPPPPPSVPGPGPPPPPRSSAGWRPGPPPAQREGQPPSTTRTRKLVFPKSLSRAIPSSSVLLPSASKPTVPLNPIKIHELQGTKPNERKLQQKSDGQQDKENDLDTQSTDFLNSSLSSTASTDMPSLQTSQSSIGTVQTLPSTVPASSQRLEKETLQDDKLVEWLSHESRTGIGTEDDMENMILQRMCKEKDMLSGLVAQYLSSESESLKDEDFEITPEAKANMDEMTAGVVDPSGDLESSCSRAGDASDTAQVQSSVSSSTSTYILQTETRDPNIYVQNQPISQENFQRVEFAASGQQHSSPITSSLSQVISQESATALDSGYMGYQNSLTSSILEDLLLIDFDSDPPIPNHPDVLNTAVHEKGADTNQTTEKGTTGIDSGKSGDMKSLLAQIEELKQANATLQASLTPALPSRWVNLHRVQCEGQASKSIYMDVPSITQNGNLRHLEGRVKISEIGDYFDEHPDVAFVVFLDYTCDGHSGSTNNRKSNDRVATSDPTSEDNGTSKRTDFTTHASEATHIECEVLREGLENLSKNNKTLAKYWPLGEDIEFGEIQGPYLFYYYFRSIIDEEVLKLDDEECQQVQLFTNYISEHFDGEYARAEALFKQGLVSPGYLELLFVPDEVVVFNDGGNLVGYQQTSNPRVQDTQRRSRLAHLSTRVDVKTISLSFEAETWEFDGSFRIMEKTIYVDYGKESIPQIRIDSLKAYPFRYASQEVQEKHKKRGETFWKCRKHRYITYTGMTYTNDSRFDRTRFMVDVATYWKIHSNQRNETYEDQLGDAMNEDEPPEGNFLLLLPPSIYGFNMQEKKWMDLRTDCISDVKWNKKAFETLAVDQDIKELITALVSNKLAADKGTDLMAGKGNGLIVLLHGGPGTGKTLTAESVAEIAEKPLYRVTCGDLGIDPIKIEEYLDSVFHLGKIWDCVVLLDEADVFLEQRTLNDLSRNALVSVFLRALEYYDGILVLTSNRVGTFDEAFKSRIQLALHYEALNKSQRRQIWENFIRHLDDMNDNINVEDVTGHISELAEYELNGRQIRNSVTTARQLALFKGNQMEFNHLKHVIKVSSKFDKYLFQLKAEATDDDWARDEGIR